MDRRVDIDVGGGCTPIKVLHVSDSHVSVPGDDDEKFSPFCKRMHNAYTQYDRLGAFLAAMDLAREEAVDLIALTGDQVNYPGSRAVDRLVDALKSTGRPWVFTAGNHDWHYEGMPGSSVSLRERWRAELAPLYAGLDTHCASVTCGDVRFVMVDNSNFQVDARQLAFFRTEVQSGVPITLLVHIPLTNPTLRAFREGRPVCGDPEWGEATDTNWETERRERWPATGNLASTEAFVSEVRSAPDLVAVMCGHIHTSRIDAFENRANQYVVEPGFAGGYRLFTFS
jgi:UDP-2,3-diacylglucosamine pyrophosphatase LpxH